MTRGIRLWLAALALALCVGLAWQAVESVQLARAFSALVDETEAVAARARDFDQEAALAALGPSRRQPETFRFDERLGDAEVMAYRPAEGAGPLLAFELEQGDAPALRPVFERYELEKGRLRSQSRRSDYLMVGGLELDPRDVGAIELRLKVREGQRAHLAWSTEELEAWPEDWRSAPIGRMVVDLVADGEMRTYRLAGARALANGTRPGELIRTIFVHPSNAWRDEIELDHLRFNSAKADFLAAGAGLDYREIGTETRPVLFCSTPCSLRYRVDVPRESPRLAVGLAC